MIAAITPPLPNTNPRNLDIARFAQGQQSISGEEPLANLARLYQETLGPDLKNASPSEVEPVISWSIAGRTAQVAGAAGVKEIWVDLTASTVVSMTCQRCLGPVDESLTLARRYRFVASESIAAEMDATNDEFDVLVSSKRFDFMEVIEDELLMTLPMSSKHEVCPSTTTALKKVVEAAPVAQEPKRNPFAALAQLKKAD